MKHEGMSAEIEVIAETAPLAHEAANNPEKPGEACGVFGIYAPGQEVAKLAYYALHEIQNRGQNGAGIMVNGQHGLIGHKGVGLIDAAIPEAVPVLDQRTGRTVSILDEMSAGSIAVAHTRYVTNGDKTSDSSQPIRRGGLALATNGHVELLEDLEATYGLDAADYVSDSDFITALYSQQTEELGSVELAVLEVSQRLNGAFSTVLTDGERLIGIRDPWAFRPLSLGALPDGKGYVFASEQPGAFDVVGATFVRDLEQGEVVVIDRHGPRSLMIDRQEERLNCMFEYIYFARPESAINGVSVYQARENMGRALAMDDSVEADIVVGVRESGTSAAIGYSKASGLFREEGLFKNPYAVRSFIEDGSLRSRILSRKQRPNSDTLAGQRVILVDDSIIKGNTMADLVQDIRDAGATEVHVRSAAPRYMHPCYFGMDTRDASQLIARSLSDEEIRDKIGADSVAFNSVERVRQSIIRVARTEAIARRAGQICHACATGDYPVEVPPCHEVLRTASSPSELSLERIRPIGSAVLANV